MKIIYKISFINLLFFTSLLLTSCGSTADVPVPKTKKIVKNLPSWYSKDVSSVDKLYGVGVGASMNEAIDDALVDCLSNVAITTQSSVESKTSSSINNTEEIIDTEFISKTIQEVKKTFTSEYYIEKFQNIGSHKAVQISLKKKELIDNIVLNIISEENNLKSFQVEKFKNENILSRINSLSKALRHSKRIDSLLVMLNSLDKDYSKNERTLEYAKLLKNEYASLNIYFKNNINPETYPDIQNKVSKKLKKNILYKAIKDRTTVKLTRNDLIFDFSSCAEGYTAMQANRKFWQKGQIKIYKGCNKLTVMDNNRNEVYSKRVAGIKVKDYETEAQASYDSYYSKENQESLNNMLAEFSKHELLQYIVGGAI